jgi:hypothetical protein
MFNEAIVCSVSKETQRVMVKWNGQDEMWFDFDQGEKVI